MTAIDTAALHEIGPVLLLAARGDRALDGRVWTALGPTADPEGHALSAGTGDPASLADRFRLPAFTTRVDDALTLIGAARRWAVLRLAVARCEESGWPTERLALAVCLEAALDLLYQPIGGAPMDGTRLLLRFGFDDIRRGYWDRWGRHWCEVRPGRPDLRFAARPFAWRLDDRTVADTV